MMARLAPSMPAQGGAGPLNLGGRFRGEVT